MNKDVREGYNNRFKNKIYSLLCEREEERQWERFLDSILIELDGYPEESKTIDWYVLYYKLSSCRYLSFKYFRTTIFDCMSLIDKTDMR